VAAVTIVVLSLALGGRTWQRNLAWFDDLSLSRAAAVASPNSFSAHEHLAAAMFQADPGQIQSVIAEAERSTEILHPLPADLNTAEPYVRLATYYAALGDQRSGASAAGGVVDAESRRWFEKARASLERARTIDQAFNQRHRELERRTGKADEAIADVGVPALYELLSIVYQRLGQDTQALEAAEYFRRLTSKPAK
jgi:tetratricopeptide (TPR) repeat protein